jgi:hypothetical protein
MEKLLLSVLLLVGITAVAIGQDTANKVIPPGSKVFIASMENGFDEYVKAALKAKKVPVVLVENKEAADFEISGHSDTEKASTAKKVLFLNWQSNEQAASRS